MAEIIVAADMYDEVVEALAMKGYEPDVFVKPGSAYAVVHVDGDDISLDDLDSYMQED